MPQEIALEDLNALSADLDRCVSADAMVWLLLMDGSEYLAADGAAVFLCDERTGDLKLAAANPTEVGPGFEAELRRREASGRLAELLDSGRVDWMDGESGAQLLFVPLMARDAAAGVGLFRLRRCDPSQREAVAEFASAMARQAAMAIRNLALSDERKRLQAQLIRAGRLASVGSLVGTVTHEFNNLLTGIIGYADFASESGNRQDMLKALGITRLASERAQTITQNLMKYARRGDSDVTSGTLSEMLDEPLALMQREFEKRGIEVAKEFDPRQEVVTDIGKLQHVMLNLLSNARDAMPKGGKLKVAASVQDEALSIAVVDTGHGITEEDLPRIFDAFFTTKGMTKGGGTSGIGLGLTIAKAVVEQLGGRIAADSRVGVGTTMTLRLPVGGRAPKAKPSPAAEAATPTTAAPSSALNILVIDDEEVVRNLLLDMLGQAGHSARAASASEAKALAADPQLDLVFLGVPSPDRDDVELLKDVRAISDRAEVFFVTGELKRELRMGAKRPGGPARGQIQLALDDLASIVRRVAETKARGGGR